MSGRRTLLPEDVDGNGGVFLMWCTQSCKAEVFGVRRIRRVTRTGPQFRKPSLIVAYNMCLRCRTTYETMLPVAILEAHGERRYRVHGLASPAALR